MDLKMARSSCKKWFDNKKGVLHNFDKFWSDNGEYDHCENDRPVD